MMEALEAIIEALNNLLVATARDGNLEVARRCLAMGADINAKNAQGFTALNIAAVMGHVNIVSELSKYEDILDVNSKDTSGSTALVGASYNGHAEVARELLKCAFLKVNEPTNQGDTALLLACHRSRWDIASQLLKRDDVDINCINASGDTPLILSVDKGHLGVVTELLKHDDLNVNHKNANGDAAVIIGSWNGHSQVVCELLKHKNVDPNATNGNLDTPLTLASYNGLFDVVCEVLKHADVDVNSTNNDGDTALLLAIRNGHFKIVTELLKHKEISVNVSNKNGDSALLLSIKMGNSDVIQELLKHDELDMVAKTKSGDRALCVARKCGNEKIIRLLEDGLSRRLLESIKKEKRRVQEKKEPQHVLEKLKRYRRRDDQGHVDVPPVKKLTVAQRSRELLYHVMTTPASDPVELPYEYIEHCIAAGHHLGSGAFGDVYMGEDCLLPKPFAVKKISLAHSDEKTIIGIERSFRRELAALKRFRHPNIIALYGFNLRVNRSQQFLVYEYAAYGSLDGFLRDDGNRARLPAVLRLSIMFELTRAVHFLHTGGCKGFVVCHRDIKSANICLTEDFTARIIDCGLAKFVCEAETAVRGSVTPSIINSSGGNAFGTPGYICPMYARGGCPFMASCDVYSIGVVMVELILGCLNGGQSTRNGKKFSNVFERYIKDKFDEPVTHGWKRLVHDADPSIIWKPESLRCVCKTAVACMASSAYKRLSTHDLLPRLSTAISLHTRAAIEPDIEYKPVVIPAIEPDIEYKPVVIPAIEPDIEYKPVIIPAIEPDIEYKPVIIPAIEPDIGYKPVIIPACVENSTHNGEICSCAICNQSLPCVRCSKGHALCKYCMENGVLRDLAKGRGARCAIKMCSSIPFQDEELCGHVSVEIYNQYVIERASRAVFDSCLRRIENKIDSMRVKVDDVKVGVDQTRELMQRQQLMLQNVSKGLDRSLAVLSLLGANLFRECPNLIWLIPTSVKSTNPLQWLKKTGMRKYRVVFVCAYSLEPGHEAFEIEVPKGWVVKIAPVLKLSLFALKAAAVSLGLPFPIPNLPFLDQSEMMSNFLDSIIDESILGRLTSCRTLMEKGTFTEDGFVELQTLMGPAYQMIAEKARGVQHWKPPQMVPVCDMNGTPMWVKGEYQSAYGIPD